MLKLFIFIYFCSFSSTLQIKSDGSWPWIKTKYLTRSNWSSLLTPNENKSSSVWFIFHYLNYCGYCKKVEPAWESIAQYAIHWSKYIQIGAYDCASESISNTDICQDEKYPQWRIYCPLTNSTQLAFHTSQRTAEDILKNSLEKLNEIADECYGKSWPIQKVIQPNTKDDLNQIIPKHIKQFQLFISDDNLQYTLYVLNNSKTVQIEPIYRLNEQNKILENGRIWKGIRNENEEISFQLLSNETIKSFKINQNKLPHSEEIKQYERKNIATLRPTLSDIDSAVIWMLNRDFRRRLPSLTNDVKSWINTLYIYYPGSDTLKTFLYHFNEFLHNRTTLTPSELQIYINSTSPIKLPELKFEHCNGSDSSKRGYPCTLWVLFHSLTVQQAILAEENKLSSNTKPSDLIISIREFIRNFFLCEECVTHFVNMTYNAENEIHSFNETVIYLWQSHNIVNQRLRYENYTNDPYWPKVPFPTKQQCEVCVKQIDENGDAIEYDKNEVYEFFKEFYYLKNSAKNHRFNYVLLLFILLILNK